MEESMIEIPTLSFWWDTAFERNVVFCIWSSFMIRFPWRLTRRLGCDITFPTLAGRSSTPSIAAACSILTGTWSAPASHAMRSPSPIMPGIAKLNISSPCLYPVSSSINFLLHPAPPVQTIAALHVISISFPSLSTASTPATFPSFIIIFFAGVSSKTFTPSSCALAYNALFIKEAALGPIPWSVFTICHVGSDFGK